jgi:hypothetical protein
MPSELTSQQVEELSEFYWDTDVSTKELQNYYGLSKPVHRYVTPRAADEECPNCSAVFVYPSRSARDRGEKECRTCRHAGRGGGWSYGCACDYCSTARAEEECRHSEEALQQAIERYDEHRASLCGGRPRPFCTITVGHPRCASRWPTASSPGRSRLPFAKGSPPTPTSS